LEENNLGFGIFQRRHWPT